VASSGSSESVRRRARVIRKSRMLPLPGEVLVAVGQQVGPADPVARIPTRPGIPWVIDMAGQIGVPPSALRSVLRKTEGDKVEAQEVLAVIDKGLAGRKEYQCPVGGIIEQISDVTGRVTIREEFGKEEPPIVVDVAREIGCKPEELPKNMLKGVGREIKKGEMLAKKGELQAFLTKVCLAPVSGVISEINDKTGTVTISRPFKQVVLNAYVSGTVVEVVRDLGCVVETVGVKLNGIFGVGKETFGEIMVLTEGPDKVLAPDAIGPECAGKVVIGGSHVSREAFDKALEVGARALITGSASYLDLTKSLGVKLGVGVTGHEDVGLTVLITEGFGTLAMREDLWSLFKALEGSVASVNGMTQIRAGAVRPEVIVPLDLSPDSVGKDEETDEDLREGQRVRIVSGRWFGLSGKIAEIIREPRVIETESRVPVISVSLDDGRLVTVPRPNVELF